MTVKKLIEGQSVIQKFKNKNSGVNIKAEGKRHPGAVIGSTKYRKEYGKHRPLTATSRENN